MFDTLRIRISEQTRTRKSPSQSKVARTICVCASPSLSTLVDTYRLWFPSGDPELEPLLSLTGPFPDALAYEEPLRAVLDVMFDAGAQRNLADKNIHILNSINQVIIFADLQDQETIDLLPSLLQSVQKVLDDSASPNAAFYVIGAFITHRGRLSKEVLNGTVATVSTVENWLADLSEGTENSGAGLLRHYFSRMYLLDMRNAEGETISFADQRSLLQQLLRFLTSYQTGMSSEREYAEWLSRNRAQDGMVSVLGGVSVTLPMDQVAEMAAVYRGAEAIEGALLTPPPVPRHRSWIDRFLQDQSLVNFDDAQQFLRLCPKLQLSPLSALDPAGDPAQYLAEIEIMDADLPSISANNKARMKALAEDRVASWGHELDEVLTSIVSSEVGGMVVAQEFLSGMLDHVGSITPESVAEPHYDDPSLSQRRLGRLLAHTPADPALVARVVVGGLITDAGIGVLPMEATNQLGAMVVAPIAISGLAYFVRHMNRAQISRCIIEIGKLESAKWNAISTAAEASVAQDMLKGLHELIINLQGRIERACKRIREVIDHFRDQYTPPLPDETAARILLARNRADMMEFLSRTVKLPRYAAQDLLNGKLFLWQRLAGLKSEPCAWEIYFTELAAIRALSSCTALLNLSVLSALASDPSLLQRAKQRLVSSISPFGMFRPEATRPSLQVMVEVDVDGQEPALQQILEDLHRRSQELDRIPNASKYNLILYAFMEGIRADELTLGGTN